MWLIEVCLCSELSFVSGTQSTKEKKRIEKAAVETNDFFHCCCENSEVKL